MVTTGSVLDCLTRMFSTLEVLNKMADAQVVVGIQFLNRKSVPCFLGKKYSDSLKLTSRSPAELEIKLG